MVQPRLPRAWPPATGFLPRDYRVTRSRLATCGLAYTALGGRRARIGTAASRPCG